MRKLIRLLLLCTLMLAIPLQGFAAAGIANCGSSTDHASLQQAQDNHPASHQHLHGDSSANTSDTGTKHQPGSDHAVKDKCSSCSACCVGAAIFSTTVLTGELSPSSEKIQYPHSGIAIHIGDSLDRPPRFHFSSYL